MFLCLQNPNKPIATTGKLFGKLGPKSKKSFHFHMVGLECDICSDCKDNHIPITKMNATKHEAILQRHLMDKTIFLNLGLKDNATFMSSLGEQFKTYVSS
jgi:hypothetical protein